MSEDQPHIWEWLDASFTRLPSTGTVAEAQEQLIQTGKTYGVVVSSDGMAIGLVTSHVLAQATDLTVAVEKLLDWPIFVVDARVSLEEALSYSAETFVEYPKMPGLVVEDNGKIIGALGRPTVRKHVQDREHIQDENLRGGEITELPGVPLSRAKYFACPKGDYRTLIVQYDPDDPPSCPTHKLALKKQS